MSEPEGSNIIPIAAVRAAIEGARPVEPPPRKPKPRDDGLPDDCPIVALGRRLGEFYYLDATRQFRSLVARDHGRQGLVDLFAPRTEYLYRWQPRTRKDGTVESFRPEKVSEQLMDACGRLGVWDAAERVRGPGAWLGGDGELVWHVGDAVLSGSDDVPREDKPGLVDRWVYPAGAPLPRPMPGHVSGEPAEALLTLLRGWAWRRPDLDPVLLLGWIGAALIGGALPWRPATWVTGGPGTGKSTLRDRVLEDVFDGALVSVSDATAAGLRARLGHATLPVALDELEAEVDNGKARAVIHLARLAASGGIILKGTSDHKGQEFTARSCFFFSSILIPPMPPQDRSRLAVLELMTLGDRPKPVIDRAQLRVLGRQLRRRLSLMWPRFAAITDRWRVELTEPIDGLRRFDARGSDVFGTLLACAEMLLYDDREEMPADALRWGEQLRSCEAEDDSSEHDELLQHILSSVIDPYRSGTRTTVADWVHRAAGRELGFEPSDARKILGSYGLDVRPAGDPPCLHLAIANSHQGLAQLLAGTRWAGVAGRQTVWVQALRRLAAAWGGVEQTGTIWFGNAVPSRAVLLPLTRALPVPMISSSDPAFFGGAGGGL